MVEFFGSFFCFESAVYTSSFFQPSLNHSDSHKYLLATSETTKIHSRRRDSSLNTAGLDSFLFGADEYA